MYLKEYDNQNLGKNSSSKNENKVKFDLNENKNFGTNIVIFKDTNNKKENKPSLKNANKKINDINQTNKNKEKNKVEKKRFSNSVKSRAKLDISSISNLNSSAYSNYSIEKKKSKFYKASLNSNFGIPVQLAFFVSLVIIHLLCINHCICLLIILFYSDFVLLVLYLH